MENSSSVDYVINHAIVWESKWKPLNVHIIKNVMIRIASTVSVTITENATNLKSRFVVISLAVEVRISASKVTTIQN